MLRDLSFVVGVILLALGLAMIYPPIAVLALGAGGVSYAVALELRARSRR